MLLPQQIVRGVVKSDFSSYMVKRTYAKRKEHSEFVLDRIRRPEDAQPW